MEQEITAYPLAWPTMRPRTKNRERAKFGKQESTTKTYRRLDNTTYQQTFTNRSKLTIGGGRDRAIDELNRFGASSVVISSNLRLRLDGLPASGQSEPADPGVAVYFQINKQPRVIACDKWDRVADNLAAIAKTIEAQRAMLRHGAVTADQIFAGFKALPGGEALITPTMSVEDAADFLATVSRIYGAREIKTDPDVFKLAYRRVVQAFHPDSNDGKQHPQWNQAQQAATVLKLLFGIK